MNLSEFIKETLDERDCIDCSIREKCDEIMKNYHTCICDIAINKIDKLKKEIDDDYMEVLINE